MVTSSLCCKKQRINDGISSTSMLENHQIQMEVSEKGQLNLSSSVNDEIKDNVKWVSSNPDIVYVSNTGEVTAINIGNATIKVSYQSLSDSCLVKVNETNDSLALDLTPLSQTLPQTNTYSTNVLLVAPLRVMQSFALDNEDNIFYSQIGAANGYVQGQTKAEDLYIIKGQSNSPSRDKYMTLKYFGHGGNISLEEKGGETYIWVSSNATKYTSGEYWDARSVSRVKFEPGKVYDSGYAGNTYFLNNGLLRIQAAIDNADNLICINASKDGTRYFYTYKLGEVEALPLTNFTFSVDIGGEDIGSVEHTVTRTVQGHDLSKLTPIGSFSIPEGTNKATDINSYNFQGYDIDDGGHIYFFEGTGNDNNPTSGPSNAYVTVFDTHGNIIRRRTKVQAIANINDLDQAGITNTGYMEAEGIKIRGNQLYIAFASRGYPLAGDDYRRANIFMYTCQRK